MDEKRLAAQRSCVIMAVMVTGQLDRWAPSGQLPHEHMKCGHAVTEASWTNQLVCVCHHLSVSGAPTGWRRGSPPVWKPLALLRCRG